MQPRSASTHSNTSCSTRSSSSSMSSVWLTARAVRYITCRLLRARASQWFWVSSSGSGGPSNPPASSGMAEMIREPSSRLPAATIWTSCNWRSARSWPENRKSVRPTCSRSPGVRVASSIRRLLRKVPLELFRSTSRKQPCSGRSSACRRDTSWSSTWIRLPFSRPIVTTDPLSPASASRSKCVPR